MVLQIVESADEVLPQFLHELSQGALDLQERVARCHLGNEHNESGVAAGQGADGGQLAVQLIPARLKLLAPALFGKPPTDQLEHFGLG